MTEDWTPGRELQTVQCSTAANDIAVVPSPSWEAQSQRSSVTCTRSHGCKGASFYTSLLPPVTGKPGRPLRVLETVQIQGHSLPCPQVDSE